MAENEAGGPERIDEPWKYPYVAAVVDSGAALQVKIRPEDSYSVGFSIVPQIYITRNDPGLLGFIDEFCENHQLHPRVRETTSSYRLEVARRDDVKRLLQLVRPFLISRAEPARLMVDLLIPALERGDGSTKEGFLKMVRITNKIRAETSDRREPKYTEAYFRDLWNM